MSNKRTFITQSGRRQAIRWWLAATALLPYSGNWVCSHCRTSKAKGEFFFDVWCHRTTEKSQNPFMSAQCKPALEVHLHWTKAKTSLSHTEEDQKSKKFSLSFSCLVSVNEPYVWRTGVAWGSPCCCGAGGGAGGCGKRTQCSRQRGD